MYILKWQNTGKAKFSNLDVKMWIYTESQMTEKAVNTLILIVCLTKPQSEYHNMCITDAGYTAKFQPLSNVLTEKVQQPVL